MSKNRVNTIKNMQKSSITSKNKEKNVKIFKEAEENRQNWRKTGEKPSKISKN